MTQVTACPRSTQLKVKDFFFFFFKSPFTPKEDQKTTSLLCKVLLNSGRRSRIAEEGEIAFITKCPGQTGPRDDGSNVEDRENDICTSYKRQVIKKKKKRIDFAL